MNERNASFMNMRVSYVGACILIILVLALESCLFFLAFIPDSFFRICNYHIKYLTAFLALITGVIALCAPGGRQAQYMFAVPILSFVLMCIALVFASTIYYDESILQVMKTALPFFCVPLLYFSLHETVTNERMYRFLINAAIGFALVFALVALFESFGLSIMKSSIAGAEVVSMRGGRARIIWSGDFVSFGAVLALGKVFSSKERRAFNIIAFALMTIELLWVAQTRFLIIALVITTAFGFVIKGGSHTFKILAVSFAFILVSILYSDSLMAALFPSELDISSELRLGAYPYYWSHSFDMGLFGLGYIPGDSPHAVLLSMIYTVGARRGAITDIGIVGYIARYGMCGVLVLVIGLHCLISGYRHRNKCSFSLGRNTEAWMALVFFIAISPTMAITDSQRIFYLPILCLLLEHAFVYNASLSDDY
jgi:hypothetical protein